MFHNFAGTTADEVWYLAARSLMQDESLPWRMSRSGNTKEILRACLTVEDCRQRWIVSRVPPINPAFALAEVVWIVNGLDDADFLNFFNRYLPKYAGHAPRYHGAYGYRLRKHRHFDQLQRAYEALMNNPSTRQVVLQIWDSSIDLPDSEGAPTAPDIPCNLMSCLNIRQGKLEWLQILRSNDIFLGLPYNFIQFTSLQEILAGWLGIEPASYNQVSNSLHVYEHDLQRFSCMATEAHVSNVDSLALSKDASEAVFDELAAAIRAIINPATTSDDIHKHARSNKLPRPYHNVLLILSAEGIRRRGEAEQAWELVGQCSNPALCFAMQRWMETAAARTR